MDKRAQSQYISWIMILAVVVAISYILYTWSLDQARKTTSQIEEQTDPAVCQNLGMNVENICQTFNSVKMNLTNTATLRITGIHIRSLGLYPEEDNYIDIRTIGAEIKPGETREISVVKKSTLSQVKIVPITNRNGKKIYCEKQDLTFENPENC